MNCNAGRAIHGSPINVERGERSLTGMKGTDASVLDPSQSGRRRPNRQELAQ